MIKKYIFFLTATLFPFLTWAQLVVTPSLNFTNLAQTIAGPGVTISNIGYICGTSTGTTNVSGAGAGTFTYTGSNLGISDGIVLSTGEVRDIPFSGGTQASTSFNYSYTDPNLTSIESNAVNDVCLLEFDFVPICNNISITYVFGSEEYPEYVGAGYNDAFGIFLTGPGGYSGTNIATLPNGVAVSIDNVNASTNSAYFHNNYTSPNSEIVFDGYTIPVTSSRAVTACSTYHMKIAIGDAGDNYYDSGVFIKGNSVSCSNPPVISASGTNPTCNQSNGSVTATVTNYTGTPTYTWTPGNIHTATMGSLAPGTYTCVVGLSGSCAIPFTETVTATISNVGTNPTPSITGTFTMCSTSNTTLNASGATSYTWNPGGLTGSSIVVNPSSTQTYTLTGANGSCTATTTAQVTVTATPTINPTASGTLCSGGTATLTANGTSATNYTWSPSGGNASTATVSPGATQIYTLTATNSGKCAVTKTVQVTVTATPTINPTASGTLCTGGTATLTANGTSATNYTWSPTGGNASTATVSPGSTQIYTLTATNGGLCAVTKTVSVNVTTTPTINPTASGTLCSGGTATLTANGSSATNYTWSPSGGNASTATVTPGATQVYTLTATNGGACAVTNTVSVNVTATPTINPTASPTVICSGATTTLSANSASATTFSWTPGGLTASTVTVSPSAAQVYTLSVTNGGNCAVTKTVSVNVVTTPTINPTASGTICSGGTATLTANASNATTYTWSPGAGSASTATVSPGSNQVYTLTVTNGGGCPVTNTVAVNVTATPTINPTASPTVICSGATTTLTANSSSATSFSWSPGGATASTLTVSPGATQVYTLSVTNGGNCAVTKTVSVNVVTTPTINPTASGTICSGGTATLTANASNATTYTWSPGAGSASTATVTPGSTQIYTLTVTNGGGCPVTNTVAVNVTATPTINPTASPTVICSGGTTTLTANSTSATTFSWNPGGATASTLTVSPGSPETYTLSVTNGGNCAVTKTVSVNVVTTPTISPTAAPSSICSGATTTLSANATSATSFSWSPVGGSASTATVNPNASQTYTLTATNGGACAVTDVVTVSVTATPTMNIAAVAPICNGQSATLNGGSATSFTWNPGNFGTPSIVVSPTVTSTYTLTGANGTCTAQAVSTVTVNPLPQVASQTITPAPCGNPTGCISITVNGGTPTYTYSWNGGAPTTTSSFCNQLSGTYGVLITDANGCTINPNFTIPAQNGPPAPQIASSPTVVCQGDTANVSASINPADPNITFTWSDNTGTHTGSSYTITNIQPPGIYTVNVTATDITNGCNNSTSMSFSVNALPNIITAASPTVICAGQSTTLNASGASSYTWSSNASSAQTSTVSVTPGASDTFTVTGNNAGCVSTQTVSVVVNPLPVLTTTASPGTICNGQSTILTAGGATTYTWSTNAVNDSITVSPNANTTYTVTGETSSCTSTQTVAVTVTPLPSVVATPSPVSICVGQTSTLTASGATTYTWSSNAGGGNAGSVTVSPTTTTTYTLAGTQSGCADSTTVTVSIGTPPIITVNAATSVMCSGGSNTLTASGASSYTWMPGPLSGSVVTVSPTSNTLYTVTATAGGCPTTDTVRVNVTPTPTISATTTGGNICSGSTTTLTASGSINYTWTPGGATTATVAVSPTVTTTYTVVSDSAGCSSQKTVVVNVTTTPTVSASNTSSTAICSSTSTTLTASGAQSYTWNPGTSGNTIVVTPSATQTYTLTGANGNCLDDTTITVNVTATPTVNLSSSVSPICVGQTATLSVSGAANYTWQPTGDTSSVITVTPSDTTTYAVIGDTAGCRDTMYVTVVVNPVPVITPVSNQTACANSPVNGLTYSAGGAQVNWLNSNTNVGVAGSGTGSIAGYTAPNVTSQEIAIITATPTYTNTGCAGAAQTDTIIINPLPQVSQGSIDSALCGAPSGGVKNITVSGGTPGYHYQWFNNGVAIPGDTTLNLANVGMGSYSLQVTDANGCVAQGPTTSYSVAGSVAVVAGFSQDVNTGQAPLVVTFSNTSTGANGYTWNFGNGSSSQQNPSNIFDAMGTYTVVLTAYNGTCLDTAMAIIVVDASTSIVIPNVYSPNADGVNDVWYVQCTGMKTLKCDIFNRWGQLVYTLNGPNDVWDGVMNNGSPASEGTYFYILNAEGYDKKAYKQEGHLTLVK